MIVPAIIDGEIHIHQLVPKSIERLRLALTLQNPKWLAAARFGRPTEGLARYLEYVVEHPDGSVVIPRGAIQIAKETLARDGVQMRFEDRMMNGEVLFKQERLSLWKHQELALEAAVSKYQGMIVIAAGGGKTALGVHIIGTIGKKALVIVPSVDLLEQWTRDVNKHLGVSCGFVREGEYVDGPVVVALVMTLGNLLEKQPDLCASFSVLVADECFAAGTLVDGVPIERIRPGDLVTCFDPATVDVCKRKVRRVFANRCGRPMVRIQCANGTTLTCTTNHRLWSRDGWVMAADSAGKPLKLESQSDGQEKGRLPSWTRVDSVEIQEQSSDGTFGGMCPDGLVYNLEVEEHHTYFANGIGVSNCHRTPANSYIKVLPQVPAKWRIGLTATPFREDELTPVIDWLFGPRLFEAGTRELVKSGHLMQPELELVETSFEFSYDGPDIRKNAALQKALRLDVKRNNTIASITAREVALGESVVVLSNDKAHLRLLAQAMERLSLLPVILTGEDQTKRGKERRSATIQAMRDGELRIVLATSLFDEGIDVQRLSRVILAMPQKAKGRTQQRTGRVMRTFYGKRPKIIDVVDPLVDVLVRRFAERKAVYREMGILPDAS